MGRKDDVSGRAGKVSMVGIKYATAVAYPAGIAVRFRSRLLEYMVAENVSPLAGMTVMDMRAGSFFSILVKDGICRELVAVHIDGVAVTPLLVIGSKDGK